MEKNTDDQAHKNKPIVAYKQKMIAAAYISAFAKNLSEAYPVALTTMNKALYSDDELDSCTKIQKDLKSWIDLFSPLQQDKPPAKDFTKIISDHSKEEEQKYIKEIFNGIGKLIEVNEPNLLFIKEAGHIQSSFYLFHHVKSIIDQFVLKSQEFGMNSQVDSLIKDVKNSTGFEIPSLIQISPGIYDFAGGGSAYFVTKDYTNELQKHYKKDTNQNAGDDLEKAMDDLYNTLVLVYGHLNIFVEKYIEYTKPKSGCGIGGNQTYR